MATAAPCCPPESHGELESSYVPKGSEVNLSETLKGYVVEPSEPATKALLILHDIFGPESGRTKEICDMYAKEGYLVVLPYVFEPASFKEHEDTYILKYFKIPRMIGWIHSHAWPVVGPKYKEAVQYLKEKNIESCGLVGFCWGAFPMTHLLATSDYSDLINGGCCFHPSVQIFKVLFDFNLPKYLSQCHKPLAYLAAKNDGPEVKPGGQVDLAMKSKADYPNCHFEVYENMQHGWVNRGDILQDDKIKHDFLRAFNFSTYFFKEIL